MDIVAELIKIAEDITADEDIFVVVDDSGANEVDSASFRKIFTSSVKTAGLAKTTIYVSPAVNATNKPAPGLRGLPTRISNALATVMNRLQAKKIVDQVVVENADDERREHYNDEDYATKTYPIGYTIQSATGSYPTTDEEGHIQRYREPSYVITLYGVSQSETDKIANSLKNKFRQESVLVDFESKGGEFVF